LGAWQLLSKKAFSVQVKKENRLFIHTVQGGAASVPNRGIAGRRGLLL